MTSTPPFLTICDRDTGEAPMALFHGFLESPALWRALPAKLWGGRRTVALPLPGHAPWCTDRPVLEALLRDDAFLDAYAATLRALAPGRSWRLVGHSTGAMIALALARRAPDLVEDVCAISPLFSGLVAGRNLQGAIVRLPVLGQMSFRWLMGRWLADAATFREGVRTVTVQPRPKLGAFDGVREDLRASDLDRIYRFGCWIGQQDMSADLIHIERPVLAMICDRDPVVRPDHQLALIRQAPQASAVVLRSGHLPMLESPQAFQKAFLAWRSSREAPPLPRWQGRGLRGGLVPAV